MPKILTPSDVLQFRQRLCDLALKAFSENGLEGISLRALATQAGCSRTTPYRYFKDKADILAAVRQSEFKHMADALELAAQSEKDPNKKLAALAKAYCHFAMERPNAYRVMYEVRQVDEQRYPQLVEQIKSAQEPMIEAVEERIRAGSIEGDPANIVMVLWAGLHGLISLHLSNKLYLGRDIEELIEVMIRSLGRAIATIPSKNAATHRVGEAAKL